MSIIHHASMLYWIYHINYDKIVNCLVAVRIISVNSNIVCALIII